MIIKGLKVHESLNEIECMLKYLEKLQILWKFNEEIYNCHIGVFLKLVFVICIVCLVFTCLYIFLDYMFSNLVFKYHVLHGWFKQKFILHVYCFHYYVIVVFVCSSVFVFVYSRYCLNI